MRINANGNSLCGLFPVRKGVMKPFIQSWKKIELTENSSIKIALERNFRAFKAKPAAAMDTTKTCAVLRDGFHTVVRKNEHEFAADMPSITGGDDRGPTPGFYGRACLASCIAMEIKIAAIRQCVENERVNWW